MLILTPIGLSGLAWAMEQSLCCHIWKKLWTGSPALSIGCTGTRSGQEEVRVNGGYGPVI